MLYRAVKMSTTTPVRYVCYANQGDGNGVNTLRWDDLARTMLWPEHYLAPNVPWEAAPSVVHRD